MGREQAAEACETEFERMREEFTVSTKDGGPAFPVQDLSNYGYGMSLRDWFAGMAIQNTSGDLPDAEFAAACYRLADAMLAAREAK